jgi:uncharacterized protein YqeY
MLTAQIREDMKTAMKAREQLRLDTLRMVLSAFTNELVSKMRKPTDELFDPEAITVIKRLVKQRKDSAEQFTKGGRPELAQKELEEITVLEVYLPKAVSRDEILAVAQKKKTELGVTDASGIGKLTGAVMKEFAGGADGNDVKEVLASLFQ